jgi:hypothetical protein
MLKYLFTAEYDDKTIFQQTQDDISKINPEKSAFYDIDHSRLKYFELKDVTQDYYAGVDLTDGSFWINGITFSLHEDLPIKDLRLIYFRRNKLHFNIGYELMDKQTTYLLGWQCTIDNKNYKRYIELI